MNYTGDDFLKHYRTLTTNHLKELWLEDLTDIARDSLATVLKERGQSIVLENANSMNSLTQKRNHDENIEEPRFPKSWKLRSVAIIGILSYILAVIASGTNVIDGASIYPSLALLSFLLTTMYYVFATISIWPSWKLESIALLTSAAILLVLNQARSDSGFSSENAGNLGINIVRVVNFIAHFWVVSLLFRLAKIEDAFRKAVEETGLTKLQYISVQKLMQDGNQEAVVKIVSEAQELQRKQFINATGLDPRVLVPEIGREISWADILNHVFIVIEFDRNGTTIDSENRVKAQSFFKPYGYLLVESPILNNRARLPIIHRDDFVLATVYDEHKASELADVADFLVCYCPRKILKRGLSGSPEHVLHYAVVPCGTLDKYYSKNNGEFISNPLPEKLLGEFKYQGQIGVRMNQYPDL